MKKRSSYYIIILLLVLSGVSILVFVKKNKKGTVDTESRNFSFKDTAAITKIFIADKEGDQSTLERTKDGWYVNKKFKCRSDAILNLMEAIKNIEVKMPVSRNAKPGVLKNMASTAFKVEIYNGNDLVKQYYVGYETPDSEGTFMLLTDIESGENYEDPYIVFIPGFQGFLQPRYIAKENEWRNTTVMNFTPPQIKLISLQNHEHADSSFTIELVDTKTFILKDSKQQQLSYDEKKMKQYLAYFQNLNYEALFTGTNKRLEDSLAGSSPFATITVSGNDFKAYNYKFFFKKPTGLVPEHGVEYTHDPDRLYLRFENDREWALIQFYVFGKLFVTPQYFGSYSVKK
jgi:hypothetical protein